MANAYDLIIAGEGVALAPIELVARLLRDRRLVVIDPHVLRTGLGYWLAWPKPNLRALPESARMFRDWIISQASGD